MPLGKNIADKIRRISGKDDEETNTKPNLRVRTRDSKAKSKNENRNENPKKSATPSAVELASSPASVSPSDSATPSDNGEAPTEKWTCESCKLVFTDPNSLIIECEKCAYHFCAECLEMNPDVYAYMSRDDVLWFCPHCVDKVTEMLKADKTKKKPDKGKKPTGGPPDSCATVNANDGNEIVKAVSDMKQIVESLRQLVGVPSGAPVSAETTVKSATVDGDVEDTNPWTPVVRHKQPKNLKEIFKEANVEMMKAAEDEKKRAKNIIIHRHLETSGSWEERKSADRDYVHHLLKDVLRLTVDITDIRRLGRRFDSSTPKRPMRVSFPSAEMADKVMSSLTLLKEAMPTYKQIRITRDQSYSERGEIRALIQEAKAKTANDPESQHFIHIVRGRVIKRVARRQPVPPSMEPQEPSKNGIPHNLGPNLPPQPTATQATETIQNREAEEQAQEELNTSVTTSS